VIPSSSHVVAFSAFSYGTGRHSLAAVCGHQYPAGCQRHAGAPKIVTELKHWAAHWISDASRLE